jgi:hypothetical protein
MKNDGEKALIKNITVMSATEEVRVKKENNDPASHQQ